MMHYIEKLREKRNKHLRCHEICNYGAAGLMCFMSIVFFAAMASFFSHVFADTSANPLSR